MSGDVRAWLDGEVRLHPGCKPNCATLRLVAAVRAAADLADELDAVQRKWTHTEGASYVADKLRAALAPLTAGDQA